MRRNNMPGKKREATRMGFVREMLKLAKYEKLNPIQAAAVKAGLLEGKNLVVAAPTASGKTFIAELAAIKTIREGGKVVYLVPLVSLAFEKYNEFKSKYERLGVKVAISVGDYDSSDPWLKEYDFIVLSNEKMDSLLRHNVTWINDVKLIVCDEVHLLDSVDRGPTLEVTITKLRKLCDAQIIALSATIKNAREIAAWLNASVVKSDWRPIKLYRGIAFQNEINFFGWRKYRLEESKSIEVAIAKQTLELKKQALFFVATRRYAESLAEKLKNVTKDYLAQEEREKLKQISKEVLAALESPTTQCKKLASCVEHGVAFHHAGLVARQRVAIEHGFREGLIKLLVATPTLAMGVNLPAFRVIVRDARRYVPMLGSVYLPTLEVHQMFGRAGRPQYDEYGEAIIIAKSEREVSEFLERYIKGEPEEIYSKLGVEPVLRTHVLALIASKMCNSFKELADFFSQTFYAHQHGNVNLIMQHVKAIVKNLVRWKFVSVEDENELKATRLGKRVNELYIDPLSASIIIDALIERKEAKPIGLLHLLTKCIEMKPLLSVRQSDLYWLEDEIARNEEYLLFKAPQPWEWEYEEFACEMKTALALNAWINEASEEEILEKYKLTPGELRSKIEICDWLLYAGQELMLLLRNMEIIKHLRKLRLRVKHGVKEDLLPLVRIHGIGRIRARKLARAGITSVAKLRKVPLATLELLLGPKTARKVKEMVSKEESERSLLEFERENKI